LADDASRGWIKVVVSFSVVCAVGFWAAVFMTPDSASGAIYWAIALITGTILVLGSVWIARRRSGYPGVTKIMITALLTFGACYLPGAVLVMFSIGPIGPPN
jgi:peptidoglycan/LPS O-acetylase OafA/YrhL